MSLIIRPRSTDRHVNLDEPHGSERDGRRPEIRLLTPDVEWRSAPRDPSQDSAVTAPRR